MAAKRIPRDRAYFLARTNIDDNGCWVWSLARAGGDKGAEYGTTCRTGERKPVGAHILAHETMVGPIPEGHQVDHTCFNKLCCNPDHLEAVTASVNQQRKWDAGHGNNGRSKEDPCAKCYGPREGVGKRGNGRTFAYCIPCRKAYMREYRS